MNKEQEYLNQLFDAARNEAPQLPVDKILETVDAHVTAGISLTGLGKTSFLTLKKSLIALIAVGAISSIVFIMNYKNNDLEKSQGNDEGNDSSLLIAAQDTVLTIQELEIDDITGKESIEKPKESDPIVKKQSIKKRDRSIEEKTPLKKDVSKLKEEKDTITPIPVLETIDSITLDKGIVLAQSVEEPEVITDKPIIQRKSRAGRRYLITENTTEKELIDLENQLKQLGARMMYRDLKFEHGKLIHFQMNLRKGNDYIEAHHNFSVEAAYVYEFGWEENEKGEFTGLFGTLYEHQSNSIPCNGVTNHVNEQVEPRRMKKKRNRNK